MSKQHFLKAVNRSIILNVIRNYGPIARAEIARRTNLSPSAVTFQTAELIREGLIVEQQEGESTGGRPPILLALAKEGIVLAGVKLAEDHASLVITNLNAEVIGQHYVPFESRDPHLISRLLSEAVHMLLTEHGVPEGHLIGIGIGIAGVIDSKQGLCVLSPHNNWRNVPFAQYMMEYVDCPVYLDNNVNTLTLYEMLYGSGQLYKDFMIITVGLGIGLGMVLDGQIYRGTKGSGGELGHTVVIPDGAVCTCGKRGCLETVVADPALMKQAQHKGLAVSLVEELMAAASTQHPVALQVLDMAGATFGQAIANLISLMNPAYIKISGEGVRLGEPFFMPMRAAIQQNTFARLDMDVVIEIEPLSDTTWARGAASLVLRNIFEHPER